MDHGVPYKGRNFLTNRGIFPDSKGVSCIELDEKNALNRRMQVPTAGYCVCVCV